jgi:hypothetical protein
LFGRLVDVIVTIKAVPTGCVVSLNDFNAAPDFLKNFNRGPYFMVFQMVTRGAALQALPETVPFEPETVAMVFAEQREFGATTSGSEAKERQAGAARQLWIAMKKQTSYGHWMGSFSTDSPDKVPALQAADLFAYELTKEFESLVNRPSDDMRWALRRILNPTPEHPRHLLQFYDSHEMARMYIEATGQEESTTRRSNNCSHNHGCLKRQ